MYTLPDLPMLYLVASVCTTRSIFPWRLTLDRPPFVPVPTIFVLTHEVWEAQATKSWMNWNFNIPRYADSGINIVEHIWDSHPSALSLGGSHCKSHICPSILCRIWTRIFAFQRSLHTREFIQSQYYSHLEIHTIIFRYPRISIYTQKYLIAMLISPRAETTRIIPNPRFQVVIG